MTDGSAGRRQVAAGPVVPRYDGTSLGAVLPGAARALGVATDLPAVDLPPASRVCVVIVDGLGGNSSSRNPRRRRS